MPEFDQLLERAESLVKRLEHLLPASPVEPDWATSIAFRWRKTRSGQCYLQSVSHPHLIRAADLQRVDRQFTELDRNTRQFLAGRPANNALLWGARGTGKSSLIKAMLSAYADQGLRLIEVDKHDLIDLPDIVDHLHGRTERFILFCDDLSFEAEDSSYKALKAILDGSVSAPPDNVLVYATSNRRHLMPEYMSENLEARMVDGELHHGETVEEKISLSERFGIWLSFHPFNQDSYLTIVEHWLRALGGIDSLDETTRRAALEWALTRGSRSGRVAWQFARDWVGRDCSSA